MKLKLLYTAQEMKELNKKLAENLLNKYKADYIASKTGIKPNTVWQMKQRGQITTIYAQRISEALNIPMSELRCDLGDRLVVEKAVFKIESDNE